MQALAADLRGLLQDPVVGGVPGERGPGAGLAGALDGGGADRRLLKTNRYFSERLPGQPAGGGPRTRPGQRGERGIGGAVEVRGEAVGVGKALRRRFEAGAVRGTGQAAGRPVDGQWDEQGVRGGAFGLGERGDRAQQMAASAVDQQVGQPGGVGVEHLSGAVAHEVVGAARGEPAAMALDDDEGGGRLVGQGAVLQFRVRQRLLAGRDDDVVQSRVGGDDAGAFEFVLVVAGGQVVERDGEQAFARPRAVAQEGAGQSGEPGGEQGEGGGRTASGEVGADAGYGRSPCGPAFGGAHAGDGARVGLRGLRGVAGREQPGAYGFDQGVAHPVDRAHRIELGCGHREGGHRLVPGDLPRALAEDQRVSGRDALHPGVRGAVAQCLRGLGAGEQRGEVADVELGLDEVGERQRGGGVRRPSGPGRVEDRAGAGEVADHGDPAAYLNDRRVAAGPCGEVAQGSAACGEQPDAQLFVGGAAAAEYGEPDGRRPLGRVDPDGADLVGPPVPDRPERIRVSPQELGSHGVHRAPLVTRADRSGRAEARGDTAPSHQPTHRRLHRLWTKRRGWAVSGELR